MSDLRHDIVRGLSAAAVKSAPPVGVAVWAWATKQLPTFVALATLIYVILQAVHLVWKWRREAKREREHARTWDRLMQERVAKAGERAPK